MNWLGWAKYALWTKNFAQFNLYPIFFITLNDRDLDQKNNDRD